jgi:RimJ/RimL family protein N-acetyltransferase
VTGFPLKTERLYLRPFALADLDALAAMYGDPEVMTYVGDGSMRDRERVGTSLETMSAMQTERGFAPWAVEERAGGALVGECGLYPLEGVGPQIELTYTFARPAWGKGYATEAGRAALAFAFTAAGLAEVIAVAHPENAASVRVLEKLGMRADGTGQYYGAELVRYVLTAADWMTPAADRQA